MASSRRSARARTTPRAARRRAGRRSPQQKANQTRRREERPKDDWAPAFLEAFRRTGMVMAAARAVDVARSTVYLRRQQDEDFAVAWADVEEQVTELMEAEAFRRAVTGVTEPIVSAGKHVTDVQRFSDQLLMFLLRSRRPDKFRDNVKVEHGGSIERRVRFDLSRVSEDRLRLAEALLDELGE